MATHSSIPAWKIPWLYSPWGCKELVWLSYFHFHLRLREVIQLLKGPKARKWLGWVDPLRPSSSWPCHPVNSQPWWPQCWGGLGQGGGVYTTPWHITLPDGPRAKEPLPGWHSWVWPPRSLWAVPSPCPRTTAGQRACTHRRSAVIWEMTWGQYILPVVVVQSLSRI